jgi:hypothetical protein
VAAVAPAPQLENWLLGEWQGPTQGCPPNGGVTFEDGKATVYSKGKVDATFPVAYRVEPGSVTASTVGPDGITQDFVYQKTGANSMIIVGIPPNMSRALLGAAHRRCGVSKTQQAQMMGPAAVYPDSTPDVTDNAPTPKESAQSYAAAAAIAGAPAAAQTIAELPKSTKPAAVPEAAPAPEPEPEAASTATTRPIIPELKPDESAAPETAEAPSAVETPAAEPAPSAEASTGEAPVPEPSTSEAAATDTAGHEAAAPEATAPEPAPAEATTAQATAEPTEPALPKSTTPASVEDKAKKAEEEKAAAEAAAASAAATPEPAPAPAAEPTTPEPEATNTPEPPPSTDSTAEATPAPAPEPAPAEPTAEPTVTEPTATEPTTPAPTQEAAITPPAPSPVPAETQQQLAEEALAAGHVDKALAILEPLAKSGDTGVAVNVAGMYEFGSKPMPQDYAKAADWYTLAAEHGDPYAQYKMGRAYTRGLGVPIDRVQAYKWLTIGMQSLSNAKEDAKTGKVSRMELETGLNDIVGAMSQEEVTKASQLVRQYNEQHHIAE